MSLTAQIVAVAVVGAVFVVRLAAAIHCAYHDGQTVSRHSTQDDRP